MSNDTETPLIWKGETIRTLGDFVSAISGLTSEAEAQEFMAAARAHNPEHADTNVGYCIGYIGGSIDPADAQRRAELHRWVRAGHPVFGSAY